ncbi:uncharacterized protein LOC124915104 [Impatiens glandulifera]|uniref:uncharacterized protein LOC124915104 n=1 Tax=Impatiens glandulifera TaxID=253017 RepID=UPI001FB19088|nr:uncharacterized protein LOC124915104 [Impatiens glandulifera]
MSKISHSPPRGRWRCGLTALIIPIIFVYFLLASWSASGRDTNKFWPGEELEKLKMIRTHLRKINKPPIKTIKSPDGDLIDCVITHQQPAFDHPQLKGQRPLLEAPPSPVRPSGRRYEKRGGVGVSHEDFQLWKRSGESCPKGTVPIRRTTEKDILRASSTRSFGRKMTSKHIVRRSESSTTGHQHAVGYVTGREQYFYGAKASINVWAPRVANPDEFSLSQIWVISGSFGDDLNTIEAGWQVSPELYGDNSPRFFTYWTSDAYQATGCYNLLCSGFIQTNNDIAIGAAISPTSSYEGGQFDISLLVWMDPKHGNWWLEFGDGALVGYWPSFLFTHLQSNASMVQFGGEIVNSSPDTHTATQMGSGHFADEGFAKASYFRNLEIVDFDNSLVPPSNLQVLADYPDCYDIQSGYNSVWGNYFYYGGPGRNEKCP